jgi:tRNA threonylcarbamoyladenosine biosynthesis protein TsaE
MNKKPSKNEVHFISRSPGVTEALGEKWGREATEGMVIGLSGELGAGKTQLVKGIARGLGIMARIGSPTFALVNEYKDGRIPLYHLDLYRLESELQIIGAGLEEYLTAPKGLAVVEWIERWCPEGGARLKKLPRYRQVSMEPMGHDERLIIYEDFGA